MLGTTREAIAAEKLAVVQPGATVVTGEPEWEDLARENGAATVVIAGRSNLALAMAAAEAFLGRPVDGHVDVQLPGRLERVSDDPLEIWDGAHNLAGLGYVLPRLPSARYVVVASILADKDAEEMLRLLGQAGRWLVATSSRSARALPAGELARLGVPFFEAVEAVPEPERAVERARVLAGDGGAVLVTGSLYLLADLNVLLERIPWESSARG